MNDSINYNVLVQNAMLDVVKNSLLAVVNNGGLLPGEHHFYIKFLTNHKRVRMATSLRKRFPETMTIVIQRQYRDLQVHDDDFEITLRFGGVSQNLVIPFASLLEFHDPHANFKIGFNPIIESNDDGEPGDSSEIAYDNLDNVVSFEEFRRKQS